jgi:glucose-1-phosphate thymidylyltransferase
MKVIIPLAGKGTRLRPHTHITPKPLLRIAGKPVMAYIMDDLRQLGGVEEVIYITGHLKERVEEYASRAFDFPSVFIEQKVQDGTAGAVALARERIDGPMLIIFVDTIFDADLSAVKQTKSDGIIWTKEVEDYQRFGVVVTDRQGFMTRIVEKPREPISKRANIGLYYVRNWKLMFEGLDHVLTSPPNMGEFFLTDAFQYMIEHGAKIEVRDVAGWYDAGKIETLLDTNRVMLTRGRARRPESANGCRVVEPVYVEDKVVMRNSTIGPNVSIGSGTTIEDSEVSHAIVGSNTKITRSRLQNSLIGDDVVVEGLKGAATIGDHSEIRVS